MLAHYNNKKPCCQCEGVTVVADVDTIRKAFARWGLVHVIWYASVIKKQIDKCTREFPKSLINYRCVNPHSMSSAQYILSLLWEAAGSFALSPMTVKLLIKSKVLFLQCYCFGEAPQQPCMLFWYTHYHTPVPDVTGKVQGILEKRNCNYLREADENLKRVNVIRDSVCSSLHIHRLTKYTLLIRVCTPYFQWFYFVICRMSSRYCSVILKSVEWFLTSHLFLAQSMYKIMTSCWLCEGNFEISMIHSQWLHPHPVHVKTHVHSVMFCLFLDSTKAWHHLSYFIGEIQDRVIEQRQ